MQNLIVAFILLIFYVSMYITAKTEEAKKFSLFSGIFWVSLNVLIGLCWLL